MEHISLQVMEAFSGGVSADVEKLPASVARQFLVDASMLNLKNFFSISFPCYSKNKEEFLKIDFIMPVIAQNEMERGTLS